MDTRRRVISVILVIACLAYAHYRTKQRQLQQQLDPKAVEIDALPAGIEVTHSPSAAKATLGGPGQSKYKWVYETSVRSTVGPLKIIEFGAFVSVRGKWIFSTFTHKPFTGDDFASWYNCPRSLLTQDTSFADHHNWGANDVMPKEPLVTRWYYVGVDSSGKRFKGDAVVEELPELSTATN
jgi:hypothetical protein